MRCCQQAAVSQAAPLPTPQDAFLGIARPPQRLAAPHAPPDPLRSNRGWSNCSSALHPSSFGHAPSQSESRCHQVERCSNQAYPHFLRRAASMGLHELWSLNPNHLGLRRAPCSPEHNRPATRQRPALHSKLQDLAITTYLFPFQAIPDFRGTKCTASSTDSVNPCGVLSTTSNACCPVLLTVGATKRPPTAN